MQFFPKKTTCCFVTYQQIPRSIVSIKFRSICRTFLFIVKTRNSARPISYALLFHVSGSVTSINCIFFRFFESLLCQLIVVKTPRNTLLYPRLRIDAPTLFQVPFLVEHLLQPLYGKFQLRPHLRLLRCQKFRCTLLQSLVQLVIKFHWQ